MNNFIEKLIYVWDIYIAPFFINSNKVEAYWESMRNKYNK